jgi:hypothetical protein
MLSSLLILIPWLRRFLRPAVGRGKGIRLHAFYIRLNAVFSTYSYSLAKTLSPSRSEEEGKELDCTVFISDGGGGGLLPRVSAISHARVHSFIIPLLGGGKFQHMEWNIQRGVFPPYK